MFTVIVIPHPEGPKCPDTARLLAALSAYYPSLDGFVVLGPNERDAGELWQQLGIAESDRRHPLLCVDDGGKVRHAMEPSVEGIAEVMGERHSFVDPARIPTRVAVNITRKAL